MMIKPIRFISILVIIALLWQQVGWADVLRPLANTESRRTDGKDEKIFQEILTCALPASTTRDLARENYRTIERKLKKCLEFALAFLVFENFFKDYSLHLALSEAIFNTMLHGGGILELYRFSYEGLLARLTNSDEKQGIEDPNHLLKWSFGQHAMFDAGESELVTSGLGFANMAKYADRVIIDSLGKRWELRKRMGSRRKNYSMQYTFIQTGFVEHNRTVVTIIYDDLLHGIRKPWSGYAWKGHFKEGLKALPSLTTILLSTSSSKAEAKSDTMHTRNYTMSQI